MKTKHAILALPAIAFLLASATAGDLKSDAEYERLKRQCLAPSVFCPGGNSGQLCLLIMSIDRGDSHTLAKLLDAVPEFVNVTEHGSRCSPVHWASFRGDTNILAVLIEVEFEEQSISNLIFSDDQDWNKWGLKPVDDQSTK